MINKIALLIVIVLVFVVPVVQAQEAEPPSSLPSYTVQKGDNLWVLSEYWLQNPERWEELLSLNPWIQTEGRMSTDSRGRAIVRLYPGEEIQGIGGLETPVARTIEIQQDIAPLGKLASEVEMTDPVIWPMLILFILLILALLHFIQQYSKNSPGYIDPVTAGPPIVPGGISRSDTGAVEERFRQMSGSAVWNGDLSSYPVRVSPIEFGTINGRGKVYYADGSSRNLDLVEQAGFRAKFRFSNGDERDLVFLQGCGNDVTYFGQRYEGFTFTPEEEVLPAPAAPITRVEHTKVLRRVRSTNRRARNPKGNSGNLLSVIVFFLTLLGGLFLRRMARS